MSPSLPTRVACSTTATRALPCRLLESDGAFRFFGSLFDRVPDRLFPSGGPQSSPQSRRALWVAVAIMMAASTSKLEHAIASRRIVIGGLRAASVPSAPKADGGRFGGSLKGDDIVPRDPRHVVPSAVAEFMATRDTEDTSFGRSSTWADVLQLGLSVSGSTRTCGSCQVCFHHGASLLGRRGCRCCQGRTGYLSAQDSTYECRRYLGCCEHCWPGCAGFSSPFCCEPPHHSLRVGRLELLVRAPQGR